MSCAPSLKPKATEVVSSSCSPARLRIGRQNSMANITQASKTLVTRILDGDGKASHAQRRAAFDNAGHTKPLNSLIDKVTKHAYQVTDEDIANARATGLSEDQIFE